MTYGDGLPKPVGTWDYFGACVPEVDQRYSTATFSLGIFQWLPKSRGKETKRGKVMLRISGKVSERDSVIGKALAEVDKRNAEPAK